MTDGHAPGQTEEFRYAGFVLRALALLIDLTIVFALGSAFAFLLVVLHAAAGFARHESFVPGLPLPVLRLFWPPLFAWLMFTIGESSAWQGSPGKRILGIRVIRAAGGRIGFLRANVRFFAKILSALPLCAGFLAVLFTKNKQALHDRLAGTHVIAA